MTPEKVGNSISDMDTERIKILLHGVGEKISITNFKLRKEKNSRIRKKNISKYVIYF